MDIVLGLSMTPAAVRMVLVEGHKADGVTVEEREFAVDVGRGSATEHLVAVIQDVQDAAVAAGNRVMSIGVTWTDESDAGRLDEALADCNAGIITLSSPFIAATTLAQAVAQAINSEHMAVLFVEPGSVTLAVIDAVQGAIADIRNEPLRGAGVVTTPAELIAWAETLATRPDGVFLIGSGVDIAMIKLQLQQATSLAVIVPEEPETALARGAALASVGASPTALATDAFAFARVCGAGEDEAVTLPRVAYSVSPDEEMDAPTTVLETGEEPEVGETLRQRRPVLLVGSVGAVVLISAVVALEVSLALGIRPAAVGLHHVPGQNRLMQAPLMPLAPLAVAPDSRPTAMRPTGPVTQLPPSAPSIPLPSVVLPGDSPGAPLPALLALPVLMPNALPPRVPDADYPNYPILLPLPGVQLPSAAPSIPPRKLPSIPVTQPATTVPVSQPPTSVPVSQPPTSVPVSQTPTTVPVTQPPSTVPVSQPPTTVAVSQPPTTVAVTQPPTTVAVTQPPATVPVSQPPTTVPVSQPPTYVPVSQPPRPVPVAPPPVHVPEAQVPVNVPAPDAPVVPGLPGLETPPARGPVLEGPTIPASPGIPAQDVPPVAPQLPAALPAPAPEPLPTAGGGSAGIPGTSPPITGGSSLTGGGSPGTGGGSPGGSLGGGSLGGGGGSPGGSLGGSSLGGGGGSSIGGSSSIGGGSSSIGGGSSSTGGSSSSGGSGSSSGGKR
nr:hypothetical protein [Mycobacterium gordonae]